jgi:hypothetical protein
MARKMTAVMTWLVLSSCPTILFDPTLANATIDTKKCERPEYLSGWSLPRLEGYFTYSHTHQRPKMLDQGVIDTAYPISRMRSNWAKKFRPEFRSFAVVSDRFARADPEEIVLSIDDLLCLIAPPAVLLLSDGTANHYVSVESLDKSGETIAIFDAWPDQSFLIGTDLGASDRGKLLNLPDGGVLIEAPARTVSTFLVGALFSEEPDGFIERLS